MTQAKLAQSIDTTKINISRYENGERWMDQKTIGAICAFFGVTADYLLGFSNQPYSTVSESDTAVLAAYHAAPAEIRAIIDTALEPYKQENQDASAAS